MIDRVQCDILRIIGYTKLKNFTFSPHLCRVFNFLLNNIFRSPSLKHQFKKYDKFLLYFIKKLNSNNLLLKNTKTKLNKELVYLHNILLHVKRKSLFSKIKQQNKKKHLTLRLIRLNRKHFKLNITQIKKSSTPFLYTTKKHIKKNNQKRLY